MTMFLRVVPALLVIIAIALTGCQRPKPLKKDGPEPGLFSGKKGEFVIYSTKTRKRR